MNLSKNNHLTKEEIIKNGSVYTPDSIVKIAKSWLRPIIKEDDFIIDFGAGYGAFISNFTDLSNSCLATDIDEKSIKLINNYFPSIITFSENSLLGISRLKYRIPESSRIIVIGNPPYNDVTSQYKKGYKGPLESDISVNSRDLGISFLKMYSILRPEIICVLHPLSYLIKRANFQSLGIFNNNYILFRAMIFSSKMFESINKNNNEFPVVLGLYKRNSKLLNDFSFIENFKFEIINSQNIFTLKNFLTIDGWIEKYPTKEKNINDLLFYTLRDINALKRNKTFLKGNFSNGIKVSINNLYKYAWVDFFKFHFSRINDFLYGNLSPLRHLDLEKKSVQKQLISYIFNENQVVKLHFSNPHELSALKKYYEIDEFPNDYSLLFSILNNLY